MARNLAVAGFAVRVWNRTPERAARLADEGIVVAPTPEAAAAGADVLVTMLPDADAIVAALAGGALEATADGATWAQASTVGTAGIERLHRLAADAGVALVDAPVLGTARSAADGSLVVLASGPGAARGALIPAFEALGSRTIWLGEQVGAATRLKLVLNHWILGLLETLTETLGVAEALDVDAADFLAAIEGSPLNSPYAQLRTGPILARSFDPPSFRLSMARKDVDLIVAALAERGIDLPLIRAVGEQQDLAIALGHGDDDASATFLASVRH